MGQGGSKAAAKAPPPELAEAEKELLPEDEFLRESLLAFREQARDEDTEAAVHEEGNAFVAREARYSAAVIEEIEQRTETFKESLEESASQLEWRKWMHITASVSLIVVVHKGAKKTQYLHQLAPGMATHMQVLGNTLACGMIYYHITRFTEMFQLQKQIAKREKMRLHASQIQKRSAFLYRPQFVIPERKV